MPSDLRGITLKIVGIGCIALPSKRWRLGLLLPLGENMSLGSPSMALAVCAETYVEAKMV